jgi:hypothetical protein
VAEIRDAGGQAAALECDFADRRQTLGLIAAASAPFGSIYFFGELRGSR